MLLQNMENLFMGVYVRLSFQERYSMPVKRSGKAARAVAKKSHEGKAPAESAERVKAVADCDEPGQVPYLWPMFLFNRWAQREEHFSSRMLEFIDEAHRIDFELEPVWATPNKVALDLSTMRLRDFSPAGAKGIPVVIDAPFAGHSATIADYSREQSLVRTLQENGLEHMFVTSWKSASEEMRYFSIDTYLAELNVAVDDLGGLVHLVGLCQGGWLSAAYAARYPGKVKTLVLAGAPIDAAQGDGPVKRLSEALPLSFYEELVRMGHGRMLGRFMLAGWKSMHPGEQYVKKYTDLFEHIDDAAYRRRAELFSRWYEYTLDLPGTYYLQAVEWIFKENRLARGRFDALGRRISLKDITIPVFMLGGKQDDITPWQQVFAAGDYIGTPKKDQKQLLAPGGHIGLFMARRTLTEAWPGIAEWMLGYEADIRKKAAPSRTAG
jgi:polyhydroxyalkanoate depolymerase